MVEGTVFRPEEELGVSLARPVGGRYYWRVRSCRGTACSTWTRVRYLDVGRINQDFNGDGYADVIVGAPYQDNGALDEGNAFVYHGSSIGVSTIETTILDNPDNEAGGHFGLDVSSAGDINGDGFSDLVIGAPGQEEGMGNVFVYYGSDAGISTEPTLRITPDDQHAVWFGVSVSSAGDVDGDGYQDILIGTSFFNDATEEESSVLVFYGSASGETTLAHDVIDSPGNQTQTSFGHSVESAGDVNGDGYVDVIIGAFSYDNPEEGEGSAFVYNGSPSGLLTTFDVWLDNPENQFGGHFGYSVSSAGDVDDDGFSDIVVGASGQDHGAINEGNAFIFYGSANGVEAASVVRLDNPDDQEGGSFGLSVSSAGDINADGYDDVLVGAIGQNNGSPDEGNAFLYLGSLDGILELYDLRLDNPDNEEDAHFGCSVSSASDINGDGFADIIVGASRQDNGVEDEGNAFVYDGSSDGVDYIEPTRLDNPANQSEGSFGYSLD